MSAEDRLADRFHCPKCRNRRCTTHHVALPQGGLPIPFGRYIVATCTLCGYSEFYDLSVLESLPDPDPAATPGAQPGESAG